MVNSSLPQSFPMSIKLDNTYVKKLGGKIYSAIKPKYCQCFKLFQVI